MAGELSDIRGAGIQGAGGEEDSLFLSGEWEVHAAGEAVSGADSVTSSGGADENGDIFLDKSAGD